MPFLTLLSPKLWGAIVIAVLLAAGGWKCYVMGENHIRAERNVEKLAQAETTRLREMAMRKTVDTAETAHEADKVIIQTKFRTITERVNHETEKLVYRNNCLPDGGLRELNAAIDAANGGDTAQPSGTVPAPATSH